MKADARRVVLTSEQRDAIDRGRFVKIDLGMPRSIGDVRARSVLVGRAGDKLRAYANVCRHQAVPLDFAMDTAMADDGYNLLCHQHGALYRPEDGYCFAGPCKGEKLVAVAIEESEDGITLDV